MRQASFPDGAQVPYLGQGTWQLGEGHQSRADEAQAIALGVELGMTLIDTAEMYGDGGSEEVVADAIKGKRDEVFVVSKVYPHNASKRGAVAACERSLKRLRIDALDLYLLHWPGAVPIGETVEAFEGLKRAGKIRRWGVSNFDVDDMEALFAAPGGDRCATNQVLYNAETRGIEFDLLPWCAERKLPVMAYSPVGQAGRLLRSKALAEVARRHEATAAQIAIAWTLRRPGMISIPKAADPAHVRENAAIVGIELSDEDLAGIDRAHPAPTCRESLAML